MYGPWPTLVAHAHRADKLKSAWMRKRATLSAGKTLPVAGAKRPRPEVWKTSAYYVQKVCKLFTPTVSSELGLNNNGLYRTKSDEYRITDFILGKFDFLYKGK